MKYEPVRYVACVRKFDKCGNIYAKLFTHFAALRNRRYECFCVVFVYGMAVLRFPSRDVCEVISRNSSTVVTIEITNIVVVTTCCEFLSMKS